MDWLRDCGSAAAQRARLNGSDVGVAGGGASASAAVSGLRHGGPARSGAELPSPAPAHVHCVAAILWYSHDLPVTYNIHGIVSKQLLRYAAFVLSAISIFTSDSEVCWAFDIV